MAENVGGVYYEVEADTSKLLKSGRDVDGILDDMQDGFDATDKAASRAEFQMTKTATAVRGLGSESQKASNMLGGLGRVLGGLLTLQGINSLIQMAEGYNEMSERIRMATSSQEEYEMVQMRLLDTANGTYRALAEAQEVYIQTADTLRSLGHSTSEVLDITDSLSYLFVTNTTSVQRAESAMSAYTKAINRGTVEVNAWESIIAAIPTVVGKIADATGKSAREVRELGFAGKLTAKDLNTGLLASLEDNRKAADGMQTTVRDAFTNMRTNLSAYLGEANEAHGATSILANAIELLGNNIDTMVRILAIAGAGAMARYIASMGQQIHATIQASLAARAKAVAAAQAAQADVAAATAAVAAARANIGLTGSIAQLTAAENVLTATKARLTAATAALAATSTSLMTVLGGPVGIIALVAAVGMGFATMGREARNAASDVDSLTESLDELGEANLALRRQKAAEAIDELARQAREADTEVSSLKRTINELEADRARGRNITSGEIENANKTLTEAVAARETINANLGKAIEAESRILNEQNRRRRDESGAGRPVDDADPEAAKRIAQMEKELEVTKLTGVARARLQAEQRLGDNASAGQRKRAADLAEQMYLIEERRAKLTKNTKDSTSEQQRAEKQNVETLEKMAQALEEAGLKGKALAVYKAEAALNKFATPEEVQLARDMAVALHEVEEAQKRVEYVTEATGKKQQQLFEQQRAWARESLRLGEITVDEYTKLMKKIDDEAKKTAGEMDVWGDQAARNIQDTLGETLRLSLEGDFKGIAKAWGNMIVQMATEAAAANLGRLLMGDGKSGGGGLFGTLASSFIGAIFPGAGGAGKGGVSLVGSTATGGGLGLTGRRSGGPVADNRMYRINEGGAPEVFNAAGGKQFLLPTQRGEVVSNGDAKAKTDVNVYLINNSSVNLENQGQRVRDDGDIEVMVGDMFTHNWKSLSDPNSLASRSIDRAFKVERK